MNCPGPLTIGYDDFLSVDDYEESMQQNSIATIRVTHSFKAMLKSSQLVPPL